MKQMIEKAWIMPILTFDEVHSTLVNETLMAILSDMHDTFLNLG